MEMKAKTLAMIVVAGAALSFQARAQSCCPSGGHGVQAATGLGESTPRATNLAIDSAWRIYEFQRDGVNYLQINDATGVVRAAVGRINETLWVLPMGKDVSRVSLSATPAGAGRVVYRTADFVVWLRPDAKGDAWAVTAPN